MAMAARGPLRELYFGFDLDHLFVRIDCEGAARAALSRYEMLRLGFVEPVGYEVRVTEPGQPGQRTELLQEGRPLGESVAFSADRIAELALRFDALGVKVGEPIQFFVELLQDGQGRDRARARASLPSSDRRPTLNTSCGTYRNE